MRAGSNAHLLRQPRPTCSRLTDLSKLNSVRTADVEVDVVLGDSSDRTAEAIDGWRAPGVSEELRIP